jgi:hypothetical protein
MQNLTPGKPVSIRDLEKKRSPCGFRKRAYSRGRTHESGLRLPSLEGAG